MSNRELKIWNRYKKLYKFELVVAVLMVAIGVFILGTATLPDPRFGAVVYILGGGIAIYSYIRTRKYIAWAMQRQIAAPKDFRGFARDCRQWRREQRKGAGK